MSTTFAISLAKEGVVEFNLFNAMKNYDEWSVDLFLVKWDKWEPALFRIAYTHGKWDWDILGIGELLHWLKIRGH